MFQLVDTVSSMKNGVGMVVCVTECLILAGHFFPLKPMNGQELSFLPEFKLFTLIQQCQLRFHVEF